MKILWMICCLLSVGVYSQELILKTPDVAALRTTLSIGGYEEDAVYLYLVRNYDTVAAKQAVQRYDYGEDTSICSFTQRFRDNITFQIAQCEEGKGRLITIELPKTNKESLVKWVEAMFAIDGMEIPHGWNADKTLFAPLDKGAGCYFEIEETNTGCTLQNYCGC